MLKRILKSLLTISIAVSTFIVVNAFIQYKYSSQRKEDKIQYGYLDIPTDGTNRHSSLIRLVSETGYFYCSGVVIDGEYALTAAHCATNFFGRLSDEKVRIEGEMGESTGIIAEAVAMDKLRDIALLKGDFRSFESMPVEYYTGEANPINTGRTTVACGFPSGGARYCSVGQIVGNEYFQIKTQGSIIYKGMSGGAVVDLETLKVIGVNSSAASDGELVAPVVGAFEIFGII